MAMIPKLITFLCLLLIAQVTFSQSKAKLRKTRYEEIDIENLIHRYFGKETDGFTRLEGIYSVSCLITKSSNAFLTGQLKQRIVERKDNYARIALMRDWPGTGRDFIEVSLSYHVANKYPIVGELTALSAGGEAYIYRHIEPDGSVRDFSMASSLPDIIEGQFSEMHGRSTITYQLSYMKIYPKDRSQDVVFGEK
jgi:hypothetical protein